MISAAWEPGPKPDCISFSAAVMKHAWKSPLRLARRTFLSSQTDLSMRMLRDDLIGRHITHRDGDNQ